MKKRAKPANLLEMYALYETIRKEIALERTVTECRELGVQEDVIEIFVENADTLFRELTLRHAKEAWLEEAENKGMKEGLKKGMAQSMEKVVQAMIAEGMPPETIAKITGILEDEIRQL